MRDEDFMRTAIEKAYEGISEGQSPFGACIVREGRMVSCEHDAVWGITDATAHAEIRAIKSVCRVLGSIDLTGCVMYATTEPCPMCFAACHWARIAKILYGTGIEDVQRLGFNELSIPNDEMKRIGGSPVEVVGGLLREQSFVLIERWMAQGLSRPN